MKMMNIQKQEHDYQIFDEDVLIYTIQVEEDTYILKNAYARKVAMFTPAKESFSLFQDKKKKTFDFVYETRTNGSFTHYKQQFSLEDKGVSFSFYGGRMMGKDILIGFEQKEFIFQIDNVDDQAIMFLKQPEFAVYASLYFMYYMANDKPMSDPSQFLSHLPEDMMSFV